MTICSKCHREKSPLRRGLCGNCYESARRRIGFESTLVDADPVRQHVQVLVKAGISKRQICRLADIRRQEMADLTNGRPCRGTGPCRQILRDKADRILAVPVPDAAVHRVVSPGQFVPATGTVRRLRALVTIGYTQADLMHRIGWEPTNGSRLFRAAHPEVTADTARRVEKLFNELQLTPGPSQRARNHAAKHGWAPPLAWDEDTIDDPAAQPNTDRGEHIGFVDRYTELRELGYGDLPIAAKLGLRLSSLERSLDRAGLPIGSGLRIAAREERTNRRAAS